MENRGKDAEYVLVPFDIGVVYITLNVSKFSPPVLVPFDIGVVYILKEENNYGKKSFSPLRYWGGLYQINPFHLIALSVLVPFDIGVVYINSLVSTENLLSF